MTTYYKQFVKSQRTISTIPKIHTDIDTKGRNENNEYCSNPTVNSFCTIIIFLESALTTDNAYSKENTLELKKNKQSTQKLQTNDLDIPKYFIIGNKT